jgi:hypothetical protein
MKKIEIETEVDGKIYKGHKTISSNKYGKFQVIYLTDKIHERDQGAYATDPTKDTMAVFVAKNILSSLVRTHLLQ